MRSIKSVVIPNGLIENLGGTLDGKCFGSTMLQESGLAVKRPEEGSLVQCRALLSIW